MLKKVIWGFALFQLLVSSGFAQNRLDFGRGEEGTSRWTFKEVRISSYIKNQDPTAARTIYEIDLTHNDEEGSWRIISSYKQILPILNFFEFDSPSELQGKSFMSQKEDGDDAYEFFCLTALHNGSYVRPTRKELFQRTVSAFLELKCPDLNDVDGMWLHQNSSAMTNLLELNNAIGKQNPAIRLVKATSIYDKDGKSPFYVVKGPAEYWYLMQGDKVLDHVTAGPYSNPITCASELKKGRFDE
jgi:hypothetical protein